MKMPTPLPYALLAFLSGIFWVNLCTADDAASAQAVEPDVAAVTATLHPQQGKIDIEKGLATIDLPAGLAYLSPDDTEKYFHDGLHASIGNKTLGSLFPTNVPLGSPASWNAIITYRDDGHVSDEDAASMQPSTLFSEMQKQTRTYNTKLKDQGYPNLIVHLIGWASQPHYDAVAHKLSWAVEVLPAASEQHKINYQLRVLGRNGMLCISSVGTLEQLPAIDSSIQKIMATTQFNSPHGYSDFDEQTDKKATYNVEGIIIGHAPMQQNFRTHEGAPPLLWVILVIVVGCFAYMGRKKRNKPQ